MFCFAQFVTGTFIECPSVVHFPKGGITGPYSVEPNDTSFVQQVWFATASLNLNFQIEIAPRE